MITSRANSGDVYYYIDRYIEVQREVDYGDSMDEKHYTVGNYFKTQELAEAMAKNLLGILKK